MGEWSASHKADPEHRRLVSAGFKSITRAMSREEEAMPRVIDHGEPSVMDFSAYNRMALRLTRKDAAGLRQRMNGLLDEAVKWDGGEDSVRVHASFYMKPTQGESLKWVRRLSGSAREGETDRHK